MGLQGMVQDQGGTFFTVQMSLIVQYLPGSLPEVIYMLIRPYEEGSGKLSKVHFLRILLLLLTFSKNAQTIFKLALLMKRPRCNKLLIQGSCYHAVDSIPSLQQKRDSLRNGSKSTCQWETGLYLILVTLNNSIHIKVIIISTGLG